MAALISNRDLCHRMGSAGRAKAEQEFGLARLVTETFSVYRAAGWKDVPADHPQGETYTDFNNLGTKKLPDRR